MAKVTITGGSVGRDPEVSVSKGGLAYAKFSVATKAGKKNRDGSWADDVWWEVIAWGPLSEWVATNVRKGSYIECEGKFDFEEYTKKDGGRGTKLICKADWIKEKERPAKKTPTLESAPQVKLKDFMKDLPEFGEIPF